MRTFFFASTFVAAGLVACSSAHAPPIAEGNVNPPATRIGAPPGIDPPLGANDVLGMITDASYGPLTETLTVRSGSVTTKTDGWGRFVLRDAPGTYDLVLVGANAARVYAGVSSRRPLLRQSAGSSTFTADVHVTFPTPPTPDTRTLWFFDTRPTGTESLDGLVSATGLDRTIEFLPGDDGRTQGMQLVGVSYTASADGSPAHWTGWASESVSLGLGEKTAWSPTFAAIGEWTVTGHAQAASGQTLYEAYLGVRFASSGAFAYLNPTSPLRGDPWTFTVPAIPNATFAIDYYAYDTGREGSAGGAMSRVTVPIAQGSVADATLPPSPTITSPADGATGVGVGSTLAWTGEGACDAQLVADPPTAGPQIDLVTAGTSIVIPDLSDLGVTLPRQTRYRWFVICSKTSEAWQGDAALAPPGLGAMGYSVARTFTTP